MAENQLIEIVNETGLAPAQARPVLDGFKDLFLDAHKVVAISKAIKVNSVDDISMMAEAHEKRMALRDIRIKADKLRVELKEGYLLGANAVQRVYKSIEEIVKTEEERLLEQEKFAENKKKLELDKLELERKQELLKYTENIAFYDLRNMDDQTFDQILASQKQLFENKKAEEEKAEKARIELEKKQQLFNDRKLELIKYSNFFNISVLTIETTQEQFEKLRIDAKAAYDKFMEERKQLEVQAEKDRKAREKAELELKKQQDAIAEQKRKEEAENKAKQEAEAKLKADAEALQRQKLLAPDKEKLMNLAQEIDAVKLPAVSSKEAMAVIKATEDMLAKVTNYIREKAKAL